MAQGDYISSITMRADVINDPAILQSCAEKVHENFVEATEQKCDFILIGVPVGTHETVRNEIMELLHVRRTGK